VRLPNCWRSSCDRRKCAFRSSVRASASRGILACVKRTYPQPNESKSGLPMVSLPPSARYVVIGAGIHGLSTAMHLAGRLQVKGTTVGSGSNRIVVLDKTGLGAGASGIACGVVRNNYYQPAMRELMAHSVSVWERDPEAYSYHPVGYMQISPEGMHSQVGTIYEQQKAIGYESVFVEGEAESLEYMRTLFSDWQAANITSVLHEKRGGYANNLAAVRGLARKRNRSVSRSSTASRSGDFVRATDRPQSTPSTPTSALSPASRSSSRSARGSTRSGTYSSCRSGSALKAATQRCTMTCACGATWRCRKARSASIRTS